MNLGTSGDAEWQRELVECEVVKKGLDGFEKREGVRLFELLLLNASKIDEAVWLEWLTSRRGLIRLAQVRVDADWIDGLRLDANLRRALGNDYIFPAFESAGSWVCGSLTSSPTLKAEWEAKLGHRLVFVAATPNELRQLARHYLQLTVSWN